MDTHALTERLAEILAVFDETEEPWTTPEVADRLDLGRRTAYNRLQRLVEHDHLKTKKVGASARVWWRPQPPPGEGSDGDIQGSQSGQVTRVEQQFHSLVEATDEYAIFLLDPGGYVQTWNPGAARIKGYDADDILDRHFSAFYTEEDRASGVPERNLRAAAHEGSIQDEGWRLRNDGSRFWATVTLTAIQDDEGDIIGYAKVTHDMTDRREYEQQLREEKAFIESLLDTQQDVLYAYNTDRQFLRWNDRFREVTGYTDAEIEEMQLLDFVAERAADETTTAIEQVLEHGANVTVELPLVTADGDELPYEFTGGPITNEADEIVGVTGIGRDISDQKARERQLERQRDDLQAELDDIFTRIDEAFFALDDDWRITYVNDRAAELVDLPIGELLQARVWDVLPEVAEGNPREMAKQAVETQESVEFEFYSDILGVWFEVRMYPSELGLSIYVRDVTERKERERDLEEARQRYRTLVENFPNGAVTLVDDDLSYRVVGGSPLETADATIQDLEGSSLRDILPPEVADMLVPRYEAALAGDASTFEGDIGNHSYQFHVIPVRDDDGTVFAAMGMSQDITERKERERELQRNELRFQTLIENFPNGAVALVDEDLRYTTFGGTPEVVTNLTRDDLEGSLLRDVLPPERADVVISRFEKALDGTSSRFEDTVGDRVYQYHFFPVYDEDGEVHMAMAMSQDITERKERELELQNRIRQQQVVTELGTRALEDLDLDTLMAEAVRLVAETLDTEYAEVLDLDADAEELLLRQGVGWGEGIVGEATVSAVEDDSQAAYTLTTEEPVVVDNLTTESRFSGPALLRNHSVRSGISTIIGPADNPWGVLGTHDSDRREFSEHDATFVQAVANILAAAIGRHQHEHELIRQHEQLAAVNSLNEVIREITSAVIEQSTREEIEETVCERLAGTDSYLFAWTGDVDPNSQTVNMRTEAGVEGYLEDMTISVDPTDERSDGPTGRALRTGEIQVISDVGDDSRYDPWSHSVEEYGFRSSAAVPIVHEDTVYGVLNIYADRPNAFTDQERTMLTQLGEVVGHAIAAADRKQALMSDDLVELEFQIEDVFTSLGFPVEAAGTITLVHTVAVGNGQFLVYGTATPDAMESLRSLVETIPHWESVTVRSEGDPTQFVLRLTDPPVLSVVASHGGYIDSAVIKDGDYQMTVHLAPTVEVRQVIDTIREAYPGAELVRRQQFTRVRDEQQPFNRHLVADLTDRQRLALEAAYYAGYFEWPRDTSGEKVAESLNVASPTFHQHLRKAEQKVFGRVFSASL